MAKAKARKLKVFQTRIGFYDVVVATAGMAAALRAWGIRQDLFAQGLAFPVTDQEIIDAAVAHPDTVLKRAIGASGAFKVDASPPRATKASHRTLPADDDADDASPEPPRPPPNRAKLTAAEKALAALDANHDKDMDRVQRELAAIDAEEIKLAARRRALNAEATVKRKVWQDQRGKAEATVQTERQAYRRAGGQD
jgi:hypothetical protein